MTGVKSAEDLYGLPLEQFTPERNGLVKRLKGDGEKDEAARVAKLRKPSTAAWAVNQLVRTQKRTIAELFKAGDQMIDAQAKALAKQGSPDVLKQAVQVQRAATEKLLEAAAGLLSSTGHELPAATQEQISETLRAAAVDPDSREQVKLGCLTKELQVTGLGGFGTRSADPSPGRRALDPWHRKDDKREHQRAEELKAAQQRETDARRVLTEAKRELAQAEKDQATAQRRRDKAAQAAERAERALSETRHHVKQLQRGGR